ncbi:hypothetical protein [Methylococcus sp. EFPC2]|uniref:hypothetical protein n=1 Tax=Methylococcus sp. EFPC2 TaxID=2812648 RepID=UPI00196828A5|nr:hypothetical protein [Methylococcus sp. EFPC2]QSA97945.1 hypothetical protein JWZ97_03705 [Methylococcus sp. EFPC2]
MNSLRPATAAALLALTLTACTTSRELGLGRPSVQSEPLPVLAGSTVIDGDDYYVQLLSEFQFRSDVGEEVCRDLGSSYRKGGANSLVLFQINNPTLKLHREVPGLLYRSTAERCASSLDAKRVYLTPWMRLDAGADTQVDYRFVTGSDDGLDLAKVGNDVNLASNVLALTGVGTGVALVGKLASGWMLNSSAQVPAAAGQAAPPAAAKQREENHSLPSIVSASGNRATLSRMSIAVREAETGSLNPWAKPKPLGELSVYADVRSSLLLKTAANGLPDARDLSLEELWRATIRNGAEGLSLQHYIEQAEHPDRPSLQPDWNNYAEVEANCRKLKVVMRDLGFNKYDRNAVLYYFLDKTRAWKNYNLAGQKVVGTGMPVSRLEEYRAGNFAGCLVEDDYEVMKHLSLPVNAAKDWDNTLQQLREKESYFAAIRALERQLIAVIRNPNQAEMEKQLFPLVAGTVLLQDRLGNFGIERVLNIPPVPGDGMALNPAQLAQLFVGLKVADTSCARPAYEQGRPVPNVAILMFSTAADSPLAKGAALEFEFNGNRISRIALQSPTFRDFRQDVISNPQVGDCRVQPQWMEWLGFVN